MKKFITYAFIIMFALSAPVLAHAAVVINEIMYDLDGTDTDREWVEIFNNGSAAVNLSGYKFFEANTNHSLTPETESSVPAGGYAVIVDNIAKFRADWPNFSGIIFDSSFSLNNDLGETLAIKNTTNNIVDQVTYIADTSGTSAGKSLQKNGDSWVIATPTPGAINATSSDTNASGGNANGAIGSTSISSSGSMTATTLTKIEPTVAKRSAEILGKTLASTRSKITFEPKVLEATGETVFRGKFIWNFGDGASLTKDTNEKVSHIYYSAGEYVINLDYFFNPYMVSTIPDLSDRLVIKIEDHKISIASFDKDGDIILKNADTKEFDLTNWVLVSGGETFTLPFHTIILPGGTIFLAHEITGLVNAGTPVELKTKDGLSASIFPAPKAIKMQTTSPRSLTVQTVSASLAPVTTAQIPNADPDYNPLSASIGDTNIKTSNKSVILSIFALAIIVTVSSITTLYFRRKQRNAVPSNAEDITIVE